MPKAHRAIVSAARPALVFVDSGAWIALARQRDQHHATAERLVNLAVTRRVRLVTTNLVIGEVHRFILFHVGIEAAARTIDSIGASSLVTIEFPGSNHHGAARAWLAKLADQCISYVDAVSFAVMESRRCRTAFSFDGDFTLAGFSLWHHVA